MSSIPCPYFPTEDTYERRITVDKEEVTLVVYDIWEQVRTKMWLQAGDEPGEIWGRAKPGSRLGDCRSWFQHVLSSQKAKAHARVQLRATVFPGSSDPEES